MDERIFRLADMVDEASGVLRRQGLLGWADWLAADAARIRRLDFFGVEHLLSAYGGMGSLNDVALAPEQENRGRSSDLATGTDHRYALLSEIHVLAEELRREELQSTDRDQAI